MRFQILIYLLFISGCFASPTAHYYNIEKDLIDSSYPPEIQVGLIDGCRSALGYENMVSSLMRYNSPYYMNPELTKDSSNYRKGWKDGHTYCDSRIRFILGAKFLNNPDWHGDSSDYICVNQGCS